MGELTLEQKKALARARAKLKVQGNGPTVMGQFGSGASEGLAGFLNLIGTGGVSEDVRIPLNPDMSVGEPVSTPRANPMLDVFDPIISDKTPQTGPQRYARRIGQELGFGVPASVLYAVAPGVGPAAARASMPSFMATSAAGDVGAGLAGQTAREIAPDNATADIIASLMGGVGAAGLASSALPKYKPTPSLDDVKQAEADKWAAVRDADVRLQPEAVDELNTRMKDLLERERATNPVLFPRANATADDIAANPNQSIYGVVENRRIVGRNVAANADEARIGVAMKREIDDYLKSIDASKVEGADPAKAIDDVTEALALTHKVKKAEEILNKEQRGVTRAATTGTGGNETNAVRQNIRTVFDRERDPTLSGKGRGYTPDEMEQMGRVVHGTRVQNIARLLGRMAPNSGALPMMATGYGGMAGIGAGMATANPIFAVPALAGGVGFAAKEVAEQGAKREIARLVAMILNGAPLEKTAAKSAGQAAIVEQLLSGLAKGNQQ